MLTPKTPKPPTKTLSRTTIIGWILIAMLVIAFIGVFTGSFSLDDYGTFIVLIFGLLTSIGFILSKDG